MKEAHNNLLDGYMYESLFILPFASTFYSLHILQIPFSRMLIPIHHTQMMMMIEDEIERANARE